MLKTEQSTQSMERRILKAARAKFGRRSGLDAFYEHGQWWVRIDHEQTFSVVDAEGHATVDGFDFEEV